MQTIDEEAVPWVERKGRTLIGKMSLAPLRHTIEASELRDGEKEEWDAFIEEKWEIAYKSEDKELDRETMIELARATVSTRSGYFYALVYVRDNRITATSLDFEQRKLARELLTRTANGLRQGVYTVEQLRPVRDELLSVAGGWRTHTESGATAEHDAYLRDVCRRLLKITQNQARAKQPPINVANRFRTELERFQEAVLAAEKTVVEGNQEAGDTASQVPNALFEGADYGNFPIRPGVAE
jgi:hypothetical protein